LLCAADIASQRRTRELVQRFCPEAEWRGGAEYDVDPFRSLVETRRAQKVLGWRPKYLWPGREA
jgi:UDP-glucose 4-epimerase